MIALISSSIFLYLLIETVAASFLMGPDGCRAAFSCWCVRARPPFLAVKIPASQPADDDLSFSRDLAETVSVELQENADNADELSPYYRRDRRELDNPSLLVVPALRGDPAGLAALLDERYHARQRGDYARQSAVDRQLRRQHGVTAYDHPPVWTVLTEPPTAFRRRQAQKQTRQMRQAFGPTGHPYRRADDGDDLDGSMLFCDLSVTEIHALLQRRTQCRLASKFEEADAVLLELNIHGVRVCDETLQWTTDPDRGFLTNSNATTTATTADDTNVVADSAASSSLSYTRDPRSEPLAEGGGELVALVRFEQRAQQLVRDRSHAIQRGEKRLAQYLALELHRSYNVVVNDRTQTWSVGGQFLLEDDDDDDSEKWKIPLLSQQQRATEANNEYDGDDETSTTSGVGLFPPLLFGDRERDFDSETRYRLSSRSLPLPPAQSRRRIETLIQDRIHKREEARFLEADAIRRELWYTYVSSCGL